jgi:hypothetical protein
VNRLRADLTSLQQAYFDLKEEMMQLFQQQYQVHFGF